MNNKNRTGSPFLGIWATMIKTIQSARSRESITEQKVPAWLIILIGVVVWGLLYLYWTVYPPGPPFWILMLGFGLGEIVLGWIMYF